MKNCTENEELYQSRIGTILDPETHQHKKTHTHTHTHTLYIYIYIYRARPGKTHVPDFLGGGSEQ